MAKSDENLENKTKFKMKKCLIILVNNFKRSRLIATLSFQRHKA
jgi:hypothetical protein